MAAIVSIISRHGLKTEACHIIQPNTNKPFLSLKQFCKTLYISNKTERFRYKGGCGICEHTCTDAFKSRAGLEIDKQLQVISNIMSVVPLRN